MDEGREIDGDIREHTEKGAEKTMSLGEKSQKIGKVLSIINEVAAETKMLSLMPPSRPARPANREGGFPWLPLKFGAG